MTTVEDVFWLYERNRTFYTKCDELCQNGCECYRSDIVNVYSIGRRDIIPSIKRKSYITPLERCPICVEEIMTYKTAYLTDCGHAYHRKCLSDYCFHKRITNTYRSLISLKCPLCRANIGIPEFYTSYNMTPGSNYIDVIENYNLNDCNDEYIHVCNGQVRIGINSNNNNHYLGTNNDCHYCIDYRKSGNIS